MKQGSKEKAGVEKPTFVPPTQEPGPLESAGEARTCAKLGPLHDLSDVAYDLGFPGPLAVSQGALNWWIDGSDSPADRARFARRLVIDVMKASEVARYHMRDEREVILLALVYIDGRPRRADFKLILEVAERGRFQGRTLLRACECEQQLGAARSIEKP